MLNAGDEKECGELRYRSNGLIVRQSPQPYAPPYPAPPRLYLPPRMQKATLKAPRALADNGPLAWTFRPLRYRTLRGDPGPR